MFRYPYDLLPDIALVGQHANDSMMLDKALQEPDSKHWQEALEYKISQLEKFETWEIVDLPHGHTAILCSEVVRATARQTWSELAGGHKSILFS
jgi:hypothetical protein